MSIMILKRWTDGEKNRLLFDISSATVKGIENRVMQYDANHALPTPSVHRTTE